MRRNEAFPSTWTVRQARDAYLAENGFTVDAYDAKWTDASFFGIKFAVPNTRRHRWAIMLHDLHHVATGFGTDLIGEAEISMWELRDVRAIGPYVGGIVALGASMGLWLAPKRALRAFRYSRGTPRLFERYRHEDQAAYDALLNMTVGELRELLNVPPDGLAREPVGLHAYAPRPS